MSYKLSSETEFTKVQRKWIKKIEEALEGKIKIKNFTNDRLGGMLRIFTKKPIGRKLDKFIKENSLQKWTWSDQDLQYSIVWGKSFKK